MGFNSGFKGLTPPGHAILDPWVQATCKNTALQITASYAT